MTTEDHTGTTSPPWYTGRVCHRGHVQGAGVTSEYTAHDKRTHKPRKAWKCLLCRPLDNEKRARRECPIKGRPPYSGHLLILAASHLRQPWTLNAAAVAGWEWWPKLLGMHEAGCNHPDSARVKNLLYGSFGLLRHGLVAVDRVGQRASFRLTDAGWEEVRALKDRLDGRPLKDASSLRIFRRLTRPENYRVRLP